jgi:hypothetical protein
VVAEAGVEKEKTLQDEKEKDHDEQEKRLTRTRKIKINNGKCIRPALRGFCSKSIPGCYSDRAAACCLGHDGPLR